MATPIISVESATGDETNVNLNYVTFNVTLSEAAPNQVTVRFRTLAEGSATDNLLDFQDNDGILTFAAGETTKQISVRVWSDSLSEFDENFSLELYNPTNADFSQGQERLKVSGIIKDIDGPQVPSLFVSDPEVIEGQKGQKFAVFNVDLSRPSGSELTFNYKTKDGSAIAGQDYVAKSGVLTFEAGETSQQIFVAIKGDELIESDEYFTLLVEQDAATGNGVADIAGIATIKDNDRHVPSSPVISINPVVTTETDTNLNYLRFAVTLSAPAPNMVSMSYRTVADGSATDNGVDYQVGTGTLQFAPGETTKIVDVRVWSDSLSEFDENVSLELFNAQNGVFAGGELRVKATGVIRDIDGPQLVSLFVSDPEIVEGDLGKKFAVFEVRLSRPSDTDISLDYKTKDGTAKAGSDYVGKTGSINFEAGETVKFVRIAIKSDEKVEANEKFSLIVTPNSDIANQTADNVGSMTILNDDVAYKIINGTNGANRLNGSTANEKISGRGGNDTLTGGAGNDIIIGGDGKDRLTGGLDEDTFLFNAAPTAGVFDTITDYSVVSDTLRFENSVFAGIGKAGLLAAGKLHIGGLASMDADDRFIYVKSTGALFFDADGSGSGDAFKIAQLTRGLAMTINDFEVI
jgi:Ca2+-binding RTX toxin-like protein